MLQQYHNANQNQQTFDINGKLQKDTMVLDSHRRVVEILHDYCKSVVTSHINKAIDCQGARLLKEGYKKIMQS